MSVHPVTRPNAVAHAAGNVRPDEFEIGPDKQNDLRQHRPYFLVPLDKSQEELHIVSQRIKRLLQARDAVTDIYILSHGWHHNFYAAVEAYDRVVSNLVTLTHRKRLSAGGPFNPMTVALHWHSDPGENGWVDLGGRPSKTVFLANVERAFERPLAESERLVDPSERFTTVFEDIFHLFARMSAPGSKALTDPVLENEARKLAGRLDKFPLRDAAGAGPFDKVSVVWSAYNQALPKRLLLDQSESAGDFLTVRAAVVSSIRFIIGAVGIVAILGLVFSIFPSGIFFNLAGKAIQGVGPAMATAVVLGALLVAILLSMAILGWGRDAPPHERMRSPKGVPLFVAPAWLYLQILCSVPLLIYLSVTFLIGQLFARKLFDERFGSRDKDIQPEQTQPILSGDGKGEASGGHTYPRYQFARLARWPLAQLRGAIALDSSLNTLVDAIDGQLAFWEMQIRAVQTGSKAATFLGPLLAAPKLKGARIHFLGHSFGALVVANAMRHLVLDARAHFDPERRCKTLCLVQGAMGSNWFNRETRLCHRLDTLACIYSGYDTANGFYYPLANHARQSAGYVGLYRVGEAMQPYSLPGPGKDGWFASLAGPPDLKSVLTGMGWNGSAPCVVNLDASRLVYEGRVATGGGHGDIYRDDLVYLVWAVTQL
jgi:hypothetical protein